MLMWWGDILWESGRVGAKNNCHQRFQLRNVLSEDHLGPGLWTLSVWPLQLYASLSPAIRLHLSPQIRLHLLFIQQSLQSSSWPAAMRLQQHTCTYKRWKNWGVKFSEVESGQLDREDRYLRTMSDRNLTQNLKWSGEKSCWQEELGTGKVFSFLTESQSRFSV